MDCSCEIDTSAYNLVAACGIPWNTLTCECTCIEWGISLYYNAINRNLLTRIYNYYGSNLNLIRVNLLNLTINNNIRIVRSDVHKCRNVLSALSDCSALEKLSYLVKKHNRNALSELSKRNRTHRGNSHKKILVKDLSL